MDPRIYDSVSETNASTTGGDADQGLKDVTDALRRAFDPNVPTVNGQPSRVAIIVFEPSDAEMVAACDAELGHRPVLTTYSSRETLGRAAAVFNLLGRANNGAGSWDAGLTSRHRHLRRNRNEHTNGLMWCSTVQEAALSYDEGSRPP